MDNYIGKKLNDRYELQDVIGYGSTSVVYKALDHRLGRIVAVRVLNEDISRNDVLLSNFYEESQKIASLSHANIIDIYDINQHKNIHYIVMEYLEGISLKQFITYKKYLSWNECVYFSLYILKALEYAHAQGVIHRDLKPQNVFILRDGSVKVGDFSVSHITSSQITISRSQLDSVFYLSPEQSNGMPAEVRSDLYSLGVIMYEMLTGRVPYTGSSPVAVAVQHVTGTPVPPRSVQAGIPIGLQQITLHAMTADIRGRYNTAAGMRKDLETLQRNPRVGFRFRSPDTGLDTQPPISAPIINEVAPAISVNDAETRVIPTVTMVPEVPAIEPTFSLEPLEPVVDDFATHCENEQGSTPQIIEQVVEEKSEEPAAFNETVCEDNESLADDVAAIQSIAEATAIYEPEIAETPTDPVLEAVYSQEELQPTTDVATETEFDGEIGFDDDAAAMEDFDEEIDDDFDYEDEDGYDDDDDDDYEDDDDKHHVSVVGIIICVILLLALAAVIYIFRGVIVEYIALYRSVIEALI